MKEAIGTGRTVELAIDQACAELGVDRIDADFEILSLPKKGMLGFGASLAKVRVFIETEEDKAPLAPPAPPARPARPAEPPRELRRPAQPKEGAKREDRAPREPKPPRRPAPVPEARETREPIAIDDAEKRVKAGEGYLRTVLQGLGVASFDLTSQFDGQNARIAIATDDSGLIIGRRGETLDALQYLVGLAANRGESAYYRISVDCGQYREKRTAALQELAQRMAQRVVESGRQSCLEPMNPFERMVIHAAVAEVEGATSASIGDEPNRRVVIKSSNHPDGGLPPREPRRDDRRGRDDRGGGDRRSGDRDRGPRGGRDRDRGRDHSDRGDRERRPSQTAPVAPRDNPTADAVNKPLYSKIKLD